MFASIDTLYHYIALYDIHIHTGIFIRDLAISPEELEKKALVDLLNDADSERFKKLVASSVKQMQLQRGSHKSLVKSRHVDRWVCLRI